jgi:hypothetical protein
VPRYLIGALSWPLIVGLFALAHVLDTRARHAGQLLCVAVCLIWSGLLVNEAWPVRHIQDADRIYYPERIACIDRALAAAGATHGIAQYWDAKQLQGLSRSTQPLVVAQYTSDLAPMEWITSKRFFRDSYDFAILAQGVPPDLQLPRAQLAAINGEPRQTVQCDERTVLIYGPGRLHVRPETR